MQALPDNTSLPRAEVVRLLELEHEDLELKEKETKLRESISPWLAHLDPRPVQIVVGLAGMVIGGIIFASIFMTKYV